MNISTLYPEAVALLEKLISIPSYSREEGNTADAIAAFLDNKGITANRYLNNVWAVNKHFNPHKPTILLNSHHDTVKPNKDYTLNPFEPVISKNCLYGLGSNDAGGCLVSLLAVFLYFYEQENLKYNVVFAASAEEEISGTNGIEALIHQLPPIDFGIVGEPTMMEMAVAEKGLMVVDCTVHGRSGHAARDDGENAIYKALKDIEWFRDYNFPLVSQLLGPVKMNVTVINAGTQHNVVPATCTFTVDIRINECYSHEAVLEIIRQHTSCEVKPRSMRLRSSAISLGHPVVIAGKDLGIAYYGSPTMSDKALMPFPALKMGPGSSARSHMADEFIFLNEIEQGINTYIELLNKIL